MEIAKTRYLENLNGNFCRIDLTTGEKTWIIFNLSHWLELGYSKFDNDKRLSHLDQLILVDKWNRKSAYSNKRFLYHI